MTHYLNDCYYKYSINSSIIFTNNSPKIWRSFAPEIVPKVIPADLEAFDPEYFSNLKWSMAQRQRGASETSETSKLGHGKSPWEIFMGW